MRELGPNEGLNALQHPDCRACEERRRLSLGQIAEIKVLKDKLEGGSLRAAVQDWHDFGLVEAAAERAYEEAGDHPRAMAAAIRAGIEEGLRQFDEDAA